MKLKILLIVLLILLPQALASDNILIDEVLYNPSNTESGGEAIELYNPTNSSIDISNWRVRSESSDIDAKTPFNTTLRAFSSYLITDKEWNNKKDNQSYPSSDYEETITLKNENSFVELLDNDNNSIDIINWTTSKEGLSIQRNYSNNSTFYAIPNLNNSVDVSNNIIQNFTKLEIDVENEIKLTKESDGNYYLFGDYAMSTKNHPTLINRGNTGVNIAISSNSEIPMNLSYSFNNNFNSNYLNKPYNMSYGELSVVPIALKISLPNTTPNGIYKFNITIVEITKIK